MFIHNKENYIFPLHQENLETPFYLSAYLYNKNYHKYLTTNEVITDIENVINSDKGDLQANEELTRIKSIKQTVKWRNENYNIMQLDKVYVKGQNRSQASSIDINELI